MVKRYHVDMADGSERPDWIRMVRDGFIIVERPANLWDLSLTIGAELEDGSVISRGVLIDGPTGEVQPLEQNGTGEGGSGDDGKFFEGRLRSLVGA